MKTVKAKDGGKTGQAAFRRLGLQDDGQLAGKAERKTGEIIGHRKVPCREIKKAAQMGSLK